MDKELLNEALRSLLETLTDTKDFVLQQAPDVIQQFLMWYIYKSWIGIIICSIIFCISAIMLWSVYLECKKDRFKRNEALIGAGGGASAIASLVTFALIIESLMTLVKIYVAPKVFLIEHIAKLAGGN